jgi:uncharacterized protein YbaP (TraB family)/TPR repeat protein
LAQWLTKQLARRPLGPGRWGNPGRRVVWPRLALVLLLSLLLAGRAAADAGYEAYQRGDYAAAFAAWESAAQAGDRDAQYNLGVLYESGQGVKQDRGQAAQWYAHAADKGSAPAQYSLGLMFAHGEGLGRDRVLAYMLLDLASGSVAEAAVERERLFPALAPLEVAKAARLTRMARRGQLAGALPQLVTQAVAEGAGVASETVVWLQADLNAATQRALTALGYKPGAADGIAGPATRAAVKAFQKDAGLEPDGEVTPDLLDGLHAAFETAIAGRELLYGQGLLWRVARDGAPASHVFGTIHSSDPRVLALPVEVIEALAGATSVSLELELDDPALVEGLAQLLVEKMLYLDGRTLEQVAGRDLFADAAAALGPYGMPADAVRLLKPWAVYFILTQPPERLAPQAAAPFLDLWLALEGSRLGKPVEGLESIDEQIGVFTGMSDPEQVAMLDSAIAYASDEGLDLEGMIQLYMARDLAAIFRQIFEPVRLLGPDFMLTLVNRLLDDRNAVMVRRMAARLEQGGAFVAVGAAHLPGRHGILHLLEQQGYQVTRVY